MLRKHIRFNLFFCLPAFGYGAFLYALGLTWQQSLLISFFLYVHEVKLGCLQDALAELNTNLQNDKKHA